MRGKYALHIANPIEVYKDEIKGRNAALMLRRDKQLAARYYYYTRIHRLNYEATIETLSFEMHISERRIIDILCNRTTLTNEYAKSQKNITDLRKEFPYMLWKEPLQLSLF